MEVYLPEMISKLKQGTGRAIRSEDDTAVISILDSRIYDYNTNYDNIILNLYHLKILQMILTKCVILYLRK